MSGKLDVQIITAGSILGLKPTGVEKLPEALLHNDLASKLDTARSVVTIPTLNQLYSDKRDEQTHVLNTQPLRSFSNSIRSIIQRIVREKKFSLVLGGDCSILIGIAAALKSCGNYGLFFLDAHADFYQPEKSLTGEAADMELGFITGRGPDIFTNIDELRPYIDERNVIHLGQRDFEETLKYKSQDIRLTSIKCFDEQWIQHEGIEKVLEAIDTYVRQINVDGFWIHFDTDVIDDESNPAVDYRLPGGLSFEQCELILKTLIESYPVTGMSVTIFNPNLDPEGLVANKLTNLLAGILS